MKIFVANHGLMQLNLELAVHDQHLVVSFSTDALTPIMCKFVYSETSSLCHSYYSCATCILLCIFTVHFCFCAIVFSLCYFTIIILESDSR